HFSPPTPRLLFFTAPAPTVTSPLSLHDALPICGLGLLYAPDPSSQAACTIGGNVAENAGGPHCLKYGVTLNHVVALKVVLPNGEDRKSTRLNSSHVSISYAVFCLKKKK